MDRRKSLKIIGASAVGIAGLVLADWKWQITDELTHKGFFTFKEEKIISAIADTFIPEGLPPKVPNVNAKPIGALTTGTDKYLIRLFEHCYEAKEQELVKSQLKALDQKSFPDGSQEEREKLLMALAQSENEEEKTFFGLMKTETITGFTTVKEVMVDYRNYKVAPGFYQGCADVKETLVSRA